MEVAVDVIVLKLSLQTNIQNSIEVTRAILKCKLPKYF